MRIYYEIEDGTKFRCKFGCTDCCKEWPEVELSYPEAYIISKEVGIPFDKVVNRSERLSDGKKSWLPTLYLRGTDTAHGCDYVNSNGCSLHNLIKPISCRLHPNNLYIDFKEGKVTAKLSDHANCENLTRSPGKIPQKEIEKIAELEIRYEASQGLALKKFPGLSVEEAARKSFEIFKKMSLREAIQCGIDEYREMEKFRRKLIKS